MYPDVRLSVGWSVGWLDCWLVAWFVGWMVGWMVGWLVGWLIVWLVGWSVGMSLFSTKSYNFLISSFRTFLFGMQLSYDPVSPEYSISISHSVRLSVLRKAYHIISFFVCNLPKRSLFISYSTSKSPVVRLSLSKKARL